MKSPATMADGLVTHRVGDIGLEGAVAVAQQHGDIVGVELATARSSLPSPVKSPATMASGQIPTGIG